MTTKEIDEIFNEAIDAAQTSEKAYWIKGIQERVTSAILQKLQEEYKRGYIDGGIETLNGRVEFAQLEQEEQ